MAETLPPAESHLATRLFHSIIIKTFLEIIFVCAVASLAAYSNFNPQLRGAIDVADQTRVAGWVYDPRSPDEAVEVQLFIDGRFAASQRAGDRRVDLVTAGVAANPEHGFSFAIEPLHLAPGRYTVQVYAVRPSVAQSKMLLPLVEKPLHFQVVR